MHNCNVCNSDKLKSILFIEKFPYFTVPISEKIKKEILKKYSNNELLVDLQINACFECGHSNQNKLPDFTVLNDLYANYYHYPSPLEGNFNPERDNIFIKKFKNFLEKNNQFKKDKNTILEIGCFDGYILFHLQKMGFDVKGCDPSEGATIGRKYGILIYKEFFKPNNFRARKECFDIIISRHFIEHVADPFRYINDFKQVLYTDGLIVIEVPNANYYLQQGLMEVFSPQHIQGFSAKSLFLLLHKTGFSNIYIEESENNLIAFAIYRKNIDKFCTIVNYELIINQFVDKINYNKKMIQKFLQKYVQKNKKIALWGAGGFAIALFAFHNISSRDITCIIDSDPKKVGLRFIGINLEIVTPTIELIEKLDLIIITSMYTKSILEKINNMSRKISILTIYPIVQLN